MILKNEISKLGSQATLKMKLRPSDNIAAIATPLGEGAISVLRVSGPDAIEIVDRIFRGKVSLREAPGYTIRHGSIVDSLGQSIDEVLVSVFLSPNSYTGENSAEISCHGGVFVTRKILSVLIEAGARQADPGEFTKRAFLNGKMDLSQAEAVSDLIRSRSERALRNSRAHLAGAMGNAVQSLKDDLVKIVSLLELQLDFSNDDVTLTPSSAIEEQVNGCIEHLEAILASFRVGKIARDGASVAIVGAPNVGKSSLFNRLLMENRSIVSPTPGTTRDFLEESVDVDGVQVKLIDTAGLREAGDEIEAEGISRTKATIESADLVLFVEDASNQRYREVSDGPDFCGTRAEKVLVVANKIDLIEPQAPDGKVGKTMVSAKTGQGIEELRRKLGELLLGESDRQDSELFITSSRHHVAMFSAVEHMRAALRSLRSDVPTEFVVSDLRLSLESLSLITGEVTTDEILNSIFSSFCIGK